MNSFQYTNPTQGASYVEADSVDPDKIAIIQREGIGIRQTPFTGATVEGTAYQFFYKALTPGDTTLPGWYFIIINDVYGFASRLVTVEVGPVVQTNTAYTFNIDDEGLVYVSAAGENTNDVRDSLISAINGATWSHMVIATAVSTNRIDILIDDNSVVCFSSRSLAIFKSGLYVELALNGGPVKDYLIEVNSSGSGYPTIDPIDSSYLYADLVQAPTGIEDLLYTPAYTQDSFFTGTTSATDITDTPEVTLPASNRCLYANDRIYFGTPLNLGERVKMTIL